MWNVLAILLGNWALPSHYEGKNNANSLYLY